MDELKDIIKELLYCWERERMPAPTWQIKRAEILRSDAAITKAKSVLSKHETPKP